MAPVVGGVTHDPIKARQSIGTGKGKGSLRHRCCPLSLYPSSSSLLSSFSLSSSLIVVIAPAAANAAVAFSASAITAVTAATVAVAIADAAASTIAATAAVVDCYVFVTPPPKNLQLTPSRRLHCKAKSGIMCQAGDDEKRLVLIRFQTESIGQVTAMAVARVERKPEQLCAGDEFQEVGYVVQKGCSAQRHMKDKRAKFAHPFIRVLGGPPDFSLQNL